MADSWKGARQAIWIEQGYSRVYWGTVTSATLAKEYLTLTYIDHQQEDDGLQTMKLKDMGDGCRFATVVDSHPSATLRLYRGGDRAHLSGVWHDGEDYDFYVDLMP